VGTAHRSACHFTDEMGREIALIESEMGTAIEGVDQ
jgi:hypothetical protein